VALRELTIFRLPEKGWTLECNPDIVLCLKKAGHLSATQTLFYA